MASIGDTANKIMVSFGIDERSYKEVTKEIKDDFKQLKEEVNSTSSTAGTSGAAFKSLQIDLGEVGLAAGEAVVAFTSLKATLDLFSDYKDTFVSWYDDMYGLAAVAASTGQDITASFEAVQEVAGRGLLSEQESAAAIKRLIDYGFSASQAADMVNALTNSAIFLKKENYSLEQAVERATYGISTQQSVMSKAAGMSQTLSDIHEQYAESLGLTVEEYNALDSATQHQINLQAEYQAYMAQGNQYQEAAAIYANSAAGANIRLDNAIENVKAALGSVIQIFAPIIAGIATFIQENKALVAGLMAAVVAILGGTGLVTALSAAIKAVKLFMTTVAGVSITTKAAIGGVIGLALAVGTLTAAVVASSKVTDSINSAFKDLDLTTDLLEDDLGDLDIGVGTIAPSFNNAAKATRDFTKELERLRRDYLEDLKQVEVKHNQTVQNLTKQIQEANVDYRRAIDERNAEFAVSQAKEEKKHQEKVDELVTQIEFLRKYNNEYNRQKLADLEFALAKENAQYEKQTQAAKEELEIQNENDRIAYEEKRKQLQDELNDELNFMHKHRDDLNQVRDVILLDEIDSLKRRYEEQKKSYDEQATEAAIAGDTIGTNLGSGLSSSLSEYLRKIKDQTDSMYQQIGDDSNEAGEVAGNNFGGGFFTKAGQWLDEFIEKIPDEIMTEKTKKQAQAGRNYTRRSYSRYGIYHGYAEGGYTGQGAVNEIAGVVHRGEYVLPQEMVDQNTGTPKGMGMTININVEGVLATSPNEKRKLAMDIANTIKQVNKSRLENAWQ